jgi:hypothetical protein
LDLLGYRRHRRTGGQGATVINVQKSSQDAHFLRSNELPMVVVAKTGRAGLVLIFSNAQQQS